MIAIKDMEMPKCCFEVTTRPFYSDEVVYNHCPFYNTCTHRETILYNFKPADCPLTEIVTCKDCEHNAYQIAKYSDGEPTRIYCRKHKIHPCIDSFCGDAEKRKNELPG